VVSIINCRIPDSFFFSLKLFQNLMTRSGTVELVELAEQAVISAAVADAATLGLHWLYDQDRIADIVAGNSQPEFTPIDASNYENAFGFFAHGHKIVGDFSGYGDLLTFEYHLWEANSMVTSSVWYSSFMERYGPGGAYVGYVDSATKQILRNIDSENSANKDEKKCLPKGVDDEQMVITARIPSLVFGWMKSHGDGGDQNEFKTFIAEGIQRSHSSEIGLVLGTYFALVLRMIIVENKDPLMALELCLDPQLLGFKCPSMKLLYDLVKDSLSANIEGVPQQLCNEFQTKVGLACYLKSGIPGVIFILRMSLSLLDEDVFKQAMRWNMIAGGDNCGRAIILGAILGASGHTAPEEWRGKVPKI